jgi:fructose-bisphosphate aldolase class II
LRMAFGQALRDAVNADPARFDRVSIMKDTHAPLVAATRQVLRVFKPTGKLE